MAFPALYHLILVSSFEDLTAIPIDIPAYPTDYLMPILWSVVYVYVYIYMKYIASNGNQMKGSSLYQNSSNQECCKYGARNVLLSVLSL